ncbi:MAG TPA: S8 family serine peptidase, partial [Bryobacteraceae bacterium]|nr:S8 family serine peptidase [Bryobacteraceae bacterium]
MKRVALFLFSAAWLAAQIIPSRYIVEFETEPAARVSIAKRARFSAFDKDVQTRQAQILAEHRLGEQTVRGLGGAVTHHYTTLVNAMAVTLTPAAAARMAQTAGVHGVYPVHRHHLFMDQAVQVHRVPQAWQTLGGGQSSAGAGIKIGMLDTGIDNTHPAFQNFATAIPTGFPVISGEATASNTNNKVIVARVYDDLPYVDNTQSDGSDYYQHGTTTAGIAAGLSTSPGSFGIGAISGIAPGAWLGNYKVGDDFGGLSEVTLIAGLEDAFNDGMNVVSYSAGWAIESSADESGPIPRAIANALAGGMLVVVAAGNAGPGLGTVSAPAAAPAAIAVGAIPNQRWFWYGVTLGGQSFYAVPAYEELTYTTGDVVGTVIDVSTLSTSDPAGYACSALPSGSLNGAIALIQRGGPGGVSCTFAAKLNNAQSAGAIGAILYDNTNRAFFDYTLSGPDVSGFQVDVSDAPTDANGNFRMVTWSAGSAGLPGLLVSQADGQTIQQQIQANPKMQVDLDFDGKTPQPYPSSQVSDFSSLGPTPGANIKPDVLAVGDWLVAPTSSVYEASTCATPFTLDLVNGCYPVNTFLDSPFVLDWEYGYGYGALWDDGAGTSFATPMVSGSAAVLMAARPGLTGPQYRSLLTNSSPEMDQYPTNAIAPPQMAGAGVLDLLGSLQAGLTASPTSVNFSTSAGAPGGSSSSIVTASLTGHAGPRPRATSGGASETVTVTNAGSAADTFAVTFNSLDGQAIPSADKASFRLAPGASQTITLTIPGSSTLPPGQYHGFMLVSGTQGQTTLRVPYWYGVLGASAQNSVILYDPGVDPSGCTDVFDFRLLDAVGLPFEPSGNPVVTTADARAQVGAITPIGDIAGTFEAQITTGRADQDGYNVFSIAVGNVTVGAVAIQIDNSGATSCSGSSAAAAVSARRAM